MTEFTADQRELWTEYSGEVGKTLASGRPNAEAEVISGFQLVCQLELGEEPDAETVRAALPKN